MAYQIYTTDSFIVKNNPAKDADTSLLLFTEKFGLIYAYAKSARAIKSKLRPSLQTTSFSSISMVKGKELWRVTNAKKHIALYDKRLSMELRTALVRILGYIERFCPKEVVESQVFLDVKAISSFIFINHLDLHKKEMISGMEQWFLLRLLYQLGYIEPVPQIYDYLKKDISLEIIAGIGDFIISKEINKIIEHAIIQSHL